MYNAEFQLFKGAYEKPVFSTYVVKASLVDENCAFTDYSFLSAKYR